MKLILTTAAALIAFSGSMAFAEGDIAQGEKDFKKCKACHSIIDPAGEVIVKGGKTGPNLWGVVGRVAGTQADFKNYDEAMVELGQEGLVWTPEEMAAYIPNAKAFLKDKTGGSVKTAMTPQKLKDVNNVIAYLAQFVPDDADMDGDAGSETEGASE